MADVDKTIGAGRRRNNSTSDIHTTVASGRRKSADILDADMHSTGKATRGGRRKEADAHATGKAQRPNDKNKDNVNVRPFEQKNSVVITGNTSDVKASGKMEWPDFFELNGKKYKNEGILSDSSGEAILFTVSRDGKKYALKVYYYDPDHRPNHKVLEKIRQFGGSGLLVPVISHGEMANPNSPTEKNDYELMEFCEGGSLDGVIMAGDEKALTEVAVKMGAAIDFLSKHGILHRDIKPANFFYLDKEKTQIVLADFGISVECPEGSYVKIDEMRSPVYAAPEFYTNVPGEPAEVGVESDYFSLGVALLCLWMGKAKLTANESALLRAKLNENLPMPKDMSSHMASLITALTRLKMADRATFGDIKRWVNGEELITDKSASNFHVVFNSAKNQVANSPAELAHYLVEDKVLGKKYLYSGRITKWLEETSRNEIAVNVEEIVEEIYPDNQEAGLMTVVYMLDPSLDYVTPDGVHMSDPKEIAKYAFDHFDVMKEEVLDTDSNLKIYFKAHNLDKTLDELDQFINEGKSEEIDDDSHAYIAAYYLAEQFNDLPLPIDLDGNFEFADSLDDLYRLLSVDGFLDDFNEAIVQSPGFILWLAYKNPALAGKTRMLIDSDTDDVDSIYYNSSSAYRILYELDPQVDLRFNTDVNSPKRIYTVEEIGQDLEQLLIRFQTAERDAAIFLGIFADLDSTSYGDYLRARGEAYFKFLKWNRYCMDVDDEENESKAGPYNIVIGAYKSVTGFLGHAPHYSMNGEMLESPDALKKYPTSDVMDALGGEDLVLSSPDGEPLPWLSYWLTVFYQENPRLDLSQQFTYEKETAKYTEFIASIAPDYYYAKRYQKAIKKIDKSGQRLEKSDKKIKRNTIIYSVLAGIPTIAVLSLPWIFGRPDYNPISGHFWITYALCAIALGMFGGKLKESSGEGWLWGLGGGLVLTGVIWCGYAWFPGALYFIAAALLVVITLYCLKEILTAKEKVDTGGKVISSDMFEYRQLDALYFAYKDDEKDVDTAVTKYSSTQVQWDQSALRSINRYGWMWISAAWLMAAIWYFATPSFSGNNAWINVQKVKALAGSWALGNWEVKYKEGSTTINFTIDSVYKGKEVFGTMIIAGQKPVPAKGSIRNRNDSVPNFIFFKPAEGYSKQEVYGRFDRDSMTWSGNYTDRKGVVHEVQYLKSPYPVIAVEEQVEVSSNSSPKRSSKAKKSSAPAVSNTDQNKNMSESAEDANNAEENKENKTSTNILGEDTLY